jgi:hypothetical protein
MDKNQKNNTPAKDTSGSLSSSNQSTSTGAGGASGVGEVVNEKVAVNCLSNTLNAKEFQPSCSTIIAEEVINTIVDNVPAVAVSKKAQAQAQAQSAVDSTAEQPSLCIPRVDLATTCDQIKSVINRIVGLRADDKTFVKGIDLVPRVNGKGDSYKRVFVHFTDWNIPAHISPVGSQIKEKLINGETIKLMYDDFSYWKCSISRLQRPAWLAYQS